MLSIGIFSHFSLNIYSNKFFQNKCYQGDCGYFFLVTTSKFFSFEEQLFEDEIQRSGIRTVLQNPCTCHRTLRRGWPPSCQFDTIALH